MNYKMKTIVEYLVAKYPDAYFYWLVPEKESPGFTDWDVDLGWYPPEDRVSKVFVPVSKDRYQEYLQVNDKLRGMFHYKGPLWDFDLLVTARITQVPFIRVWMHTIGSTTHALRRIITVDDMPLMSFKKCVKVCRDEEIQDRLAITGYMTANRNCFISFWEKDAVAKLMLKYASPSSVRVFREKSHDTSPIRVEKLLLKTPEIVRAAALRDKPLTVGYTQRWEIIHRKSADIMDIMEQQFVYHSGRRPMRFVITSNSKKAVVRAGDWCEAVRAPREEFWRMMREEVDVILILTIDDDYSMSLIEPLTMGTPAIVLDAQYARPTLGDDYPFLVKNDTEAYAMVNMFAEDYAGMYQKFAKWQQTTFKRLMIDERNKVWLPYFVEEEIRIHERELAAFGARTGDNLVTKELLKDLPDEFIFDEEMKRAYDDGRLKKDLLEWRLGPGIRQNFEYHEWYRLKADLMARHGYVDASPVPGHMKKRA